MVKKERLLRITRLLALSSADPEGISSDNFAATCSLIELLLGEEKADNFYDVLDQHKNRYYSRVDRESLLQIVFNEGKENKCQTSTSTATLSSTQKKVIRTA